jgi:FtsP/CotA-like multicopper oxidase with cupredoxin domain
VHVNGNAQTHSSTIFRRISICGENAMLKRYLNRRHFIKLAGAAGVALGVGIQGSRATDAANTAPVPGGHGPAFKPNFQGTADEMDAAHEKGVKFFLDNIGKDKEFWTAQLQPKMDGDTKVFEITCTEGPWETEPGVTQNAMMYNGRVPGPIIRVTEGDKVRVIVNNQMTQSTSIHWHGVHTANSMDGVPYVTQPPIKPGTSFTYEFVARPAGTHMYHSHHNAAEQVTRGLMAPFIIDPIDLVNEPRVDAEYIMVLNDAGIGLTINGKSFPATQPIVAKKGDRIRIRYMNEGLMIHPMHLHGMYQQVIAKDGAKLPAPYLADTLNIAPGERYDVIVDCQEPGAWAFHCHILTHAESNHGMFGMVTALVIK